MTIKQLKEVIANLPDDMLVIVQKDSEGNAYSPLAGVDHNSVYLPTTTWYGEVFDTTWSADDAGMDEDEWEGIKSRERSLILFPVN